MGVGALRLPLWFAPQQPSSAAKSYAYSCSRFRKSKLVAVQAATLFAAELGCCGAEGNAYVPRFVILSA